MNHLTTSTKRKPSVLSKRISAVGFGAVAAAALLFSTGSAEAGKAELKLLQTNLPANVVLSNPGPGQTLATADQLEAAVKTIIEGNATNKKFKAGVLVGEALKTEASVSNNAGDDIADGVAAAYGASLSTVAVRVVGDAAKTAATGKGAVAFEVSPFVTGIFGPGSQADVLAAAELARSSKTAVAEILAGFAVEAADITDLGVAALSNKKLAGAVTEISRELGNLLPQQDIAEFVTRLSLVKTSSTSKVATGVVAAQPNQAGAVTDALLADGALKAVVVKGMTGYAKAVGAVADIEQVSVVGASLALQVGANATNYKVAAGLTKTLVQAIIAKPATSTELNAVSGSLSANNRVDEIGEVAAYVVGGILNNSALPTSGKKFEGTVIGIIKSAIAGTKTKNKALKEIVTAVTSIVANGDDTRNLWADVAASVAFTLKNSAKFASADFSFLTDAKNLKAIAGKDAGLQQQVKTAVELALAGTTPERFENGNVLANLVDPETDKRNF